VSYRPRSSLPPTCWPGWPPASPVLFRLARPGWAAPHRLRWRSAWTRSGRSFSTGCRIGAGRAVGISKTEVGDSMDLLLGPLAALGFCQPDGTFITTLADLGGYLEEMALSGEAVCVDGLATRVQREVLPVSPRPDCLASAAMAAFRNDAGALWRTALWQTVG
jgi:hypothetical protein